MQIPRCDKAKSPISESRTHYGWTLARGSLQSPAVTETSDKAGLTKLGWDEQWQLTFEAAGLSGTRAARVVGEGQDILRIQFSPTEGTFAAIGGRLRHDAETRLDFPAVGDWVTVEWTPGDDRALVRKVLERRSCLVRKTAGRT